jgi:phosphoglycerate dehydrogenase-like enzyme
MNVLILCKDVDPHLYKSYLTSDFPDVNFQAAAKEDEVGDYIEKADILTAMRISDGLLSRARNLKWIQCMITGTDFIEKLPAFQARKDIILTSSRGIHGPQMAEMAIMLMIAMNRQFPRIIRNQDRRVWDPWPARLLYGKKVAILGVGAIGRTIAHRCKAFEMTVYGINPSRRELDVLDAYFGLDELGEATSKADYFICVAPSKPDNQKMLDAEFFARMKPDAFFINLGRGDTVDEAALLQVLQDRKIAGAALDTFWQEPLPPDHPFWGMDNVIVTPHIGGRCDVYAQQAATIFRENLKRYLGGERKDLVNLIERK